MTRRRITGVILILASITTGVALWTLSASGATPYNRASVTCAKDGYDASAFRRQVDPLVSYGQPVSAHPHDWFGRLDISSTMGARTIVPNPSHPEDPGWNAPAYSNCAVYGDWASYGVPTPLFNGVTILPGKLTNTYQSPRGTPVAFEPFGMTFVAGNSHGVGPAPDPHVRFTCGDIDGIAADHPIDCTAVTGGVVTAEVTFPDCWDGTKTFDTGAGIAPAHFSYSVAGKCPAGSVPCVPGTLIPQLIMQETFIDPRTSKPMTNPNNANGTLGLSFSSGPYYTYHADYINTWNHQINEITVTCLNYGPCAPHALVGLHILE